MKALADLLFRPATIALVGASSNPAKHSALPQKHLMAHGYAGRIYPINPGRDEVFGLPSFATVSAVPEQIDHAYIMLPTDQVLDAAADCARARVGCVTIMSNGFSESGEIGLARQTALLALAREAGMRVLGPNALGVVDVRGKLALSANEVLSMPDLKAGDIGLISQSGSMLGAILSRGQARSIGFSKLVSVGNEADISTAELIDVLADDPHTAVIMLFLETIREPEAVRRAVYHAAQAGKPVLAYRLGRSALGQQLAVSHTGALVGSARATGAFLRDIGVAELLSFDAVLDAPPLFRGRQPSAACRVGVMTTTGGGGALVVDNLGQLGIEVQAPSAAMRTALASQNITVEDAPLVDLTLAGTNAVTYGAVLRAFQAADNVDALICVAGSSSQFRPERVVAPIIAAHACDAGKPLAVFLAPHAERSRGLLAEAGIPVFSQPEACADAFRALFAWRAPRPPAALDGHAADAVQARMFDDVTSAATLSAADAQALFGRLGIAQAAEWVLGPEPDKWAAELEPIHYPCVLKIVSADIPHKTEAGGVQLGIADRPGLVAAAGAMLRAVGERAPGARIDGFQVQPMIRGIAEVLIGLSRDAAVGPVISVGMGGVLAELYQDISIRPAPVSVEGALEMIGEVKAFAQLSGFRNLPRGDLGALADAVARLSMLAQADGGRVLEAEINPLVVMREGDGVCAVDGLIVLAKPTSVPSRPALSEP